MHINHGGNIVLITLFTCLLVATLGVTEKSSTRSKGKGQLALSERALPSDSADSDHESRLLANSVEKFTNFRDRHPELADRFVDVKYTDLVTDPIVVLRSIYTQFGIQLTHKAVERMRALVGARARYAKPRKLRPLAELGNHVAQDVSRFEQYCLRFGISWQTPLF